MHIYLSFDTYFLTLKVINLHTYGLQSLSQKAEDYFFTQHTYIHIESIDYFFTQHTYIYIHIESILERISLNIFMPFYLLCDLYEFHFLESFAMLISTRILVIS